MNAYVSSDLGEVSARHSPPVHWPVWRLEAKREVHVRVHRRHRRVQPDLNVRVGRHVRLAAVITGTNTGTMTSGTIMASTAAAALWRAPVHA